jgi:hypothetical protein
MSAEMEALGEAARKRHREHVRREQEEYDRIVAWARQRMKRAHLASKEQADG